MTAEARTSPVDVEAHAPRGVGVALADLSVPATEQVAAGGDEIEWVAQAAADGDVEHGHRGAGAAGRIGKSPAPRRDHAVDEGDAGVVEGEVVFGGQIVLDAEVFHQHLYEELGTQVRFAVAVVRRVPRIGDAVQVTLGFEGDSLGPVVDRRDGVINVEGFRTGQTRCAQQIHSSDIDRVVLIDRQQ